MIAERQGLRIQVEGAVQGVGFRPFVYRLAHQLGLVGYVVNTPQGVLIEAEGQPDDLETFFARLHSERPALARIQGIQSKAITASGLRRFEIRRSEANGLRTALVLPDIATCADCMREIFDPDNRRYRYPFSNCTHCGPRYSIIRSLPYDRFNTSMRHFTMCPACQAEYDDPLDRRFHAQPNACPICGPHLDLWDSSGKRVSSHDEALTGAAEAIQQGQIVAIKGIGGFQLLADARNEDAVQRLRQRKQRPHKPFALMYPSLDYLTWDCAVSPLEADLLTSSAAPIVLLWADEAQLAPNVAPGNPTLGVMLPYTPLHHLLMAELGFPVVATSGNRSEEPICIDSHEARERLSGIADLFLLHNRPIVRQVDDSVVQVVGGAAQVLRRARGYAPLPVMVDANLPNILALGAQQKNTVAAARDQQVFISQHIGDLDSTGARRLVERTIGDFETLYDWSPTVVAHDLHPDYASTQMANALPQPRIAVQHHYAHALACMVEHQLEAPVLAVCWDGTGYGSDGSIWGGEWLRVAGDAFERVAHLRGFHLPGGEQAVKEPRRSALGLLYEIYGDDVLDMTHLAPLRDLSERERLVLVAMLKQSLNAPVTSSMGRLFDAVASLLGLCQQSSFEAQAAMALEHAVTSSEARYAFCFADGVVDWEPMLRALLDDISQGHPLGEIAARFHHSLADMILALAHRSGEAQILLTGGCFQNRHLTEIAAARLRAAGFSPYWHQQVPPNDGGIALGQVMAAARVYRR